MFGITRFVVYISLNVGDFYIIRMSRNRSWSTLFHCKLDRVVNVVDYIFEYKELAKIVGPYSKAVAFPIL